MPSFQGALVALLACAAACAAAPPHYDTSARREPSGDRLQVHIVPHSHDDAGWLKTVDQYYWGLRQDIQAAGVQYILDTVVQSLTANPDRRFSYAEMAFFTRWWNQQDAATRAHVSALVAAGRLNFVNGGYVQHDEAAAHYVSMVDQTTLGHRFLKQAFGVAPTVGFQVDPFGHSSTQAGLMGASLGFDALFFGRADYQDMAARAAAKQLEVLWQGSGGAPASDAPASSLFTGNFASGNYGPPRGFWWEWAAGSPDAVIADDPSLKEFNVRERVDTFVARCLEQANVTAGRDIMLTMGSDFHYANAHVWYKNLDKLIHYVNADGRIHAFYSSPAEYVAAKHAYNASWPVKKDDDFFPYADAPHAYWTAYFSSRAASKGYIRAASAYLQAARQLEAFVGRAPGGHGSGAPTTAALEEAVALCQHHDAITGTAKQHVANDYHARIHEGLRQAGRVVARALERLIAGESASAASLSAATEASSEVQRRRALRAVHPGDDNAAAALFAAVEADREAEVEEAATEAAAVRARHGDPESLRLEGCPWANVSACAPAVDLSRLGAPIFTVAYNPLAWQRAAPLRVPVSSTATKAWRVFDPAGKEVPCQLVPASAATARLQGLLGGVGALDATAAADAELVFTANLPPVGYSSFVLHPVDPAAREAAAPENSTASAAAASFSSPQPSKVSPSLKDPVSISNGLVTVEFNPATGLMSSVAVADGPTLRLSAALRWYNASDGMESDENRGQASGAYIFRPNGDYPVTSDTGNPSGAAPSAAPHAALFRGHGDSRKAGAGAGDPPPVTLQVIQGEEVSEVRQSFADWATLTTRLYQGQSHVEVEWTVGPIPIADNLGKEVIVRYTAPDVASGGVLATDANGRAMVRRRRDFRPTWDLEVNEPVAGNYYPVTAAAYIEDSDVQLAVVTDRAQGAASLRDGEIELMVHRRALFDDGRGVREPLNETACGCTECECPGLAVRGRHWLVVAAPGEAPAARRTAQQLLNDPPLALYAPLPEEAANAGHRGSPLRRTFSLTGGRGVGPASHILTLMRPSPRSLLVRVAHLMEEDEVSSVPGGSSGGGGGGANGTVSEDLGALLARFNCGGEAQELTLSANQLLSAAKARRLHFRPGRVLGDGRDGGAAQSNAAAAFEANNARPDANGNIPWVTHLRPMEVRTYEVEC